jgi:choline kinase
VLDARRGQPRRADDEDGDGSSAADDDEDEDGRRDGRGAGGAEGSDPAALRRAMAQLRAETRAWRAANSAQWVLWGVVQAKVPGAPLSPAPPPLDAGGDAAGRPDDAASLPEPPPPEPAEEAEGGGGGDAHEASFDYLRYARERAAFFWGDVLGLGIMRREELPADVVAGARVVEY